jgi:hypothetical protein
MGKECSQISIFDKSMHFIEKNLSLTQFFLKKRYSFAAKSIYAYGEAALNFLLLMKSTCHWKLVYMYISCQQQRLFSGDGIGMGGLAWSHGGMEPKAKDSSS